MFQGRPRGYIKIPNNGGLNARGRDLTYMLWVFPTGHPGLIISHGLILAINKRGKLTLSVYRTRLVSSRILPVRRWSFLAVKYLKRKNKILLFVQNRLVLSKRLRRAPSTRGPVYIGGTPRARTGFGGRIACLQIFKAAITRTQMARRSNKCFRKFLIKNFKTV